MRYDFGWLFDPIDFTTFADEYWAKQHLLLQRKKPEYYKHLLPEESLEFALYSGCRTPGAVDILGSDEYRAPCRAPQKAAAALRAGRSLRIAGIQRFSSEITSLTKNLQQSIGLSVNVNMYLTPSASKALPRHYDTHDVIVIQIHGRKRWTLYDPPAPFPLESIPLMRGESFDEMSTKRISNAYKADDCIVTKEICLDAGDLLYLPYGHWHEAETQMDVTSCHLTIGLQTLSYVDLLTLAIGKASAKDARLRQPLPLGFATHKDGNEDASSQIDGILKDLPFVIDTPASLVELGEVFRGNNQDFLDNDLLGEAKSRVKTPSADGVLQKRDGILCHVQVRDGLVEMTFGSCRVSRPADFQDIFRYVARESRLTPFTIPTSIPQKEIIRLIEELIERGLLEVHNAIDERKEEDGWLPVNVNMKSGTVGWMRCSKYTFKEPFFEQSIRRWELELLAPERKTTSLSDLLRSQTGETPAGFIFHISRCGSTLLANGLKTYPDVAVMAEPQPISDVLLSDKPITVLRPVLEAFSDSFRKQAKTTIFKFTSWHILYLDEIRALWPAVPIIFVVRDPLEVAVSSCEAPPGWSTWRRDPGFLRKILSSSIEDELPEINEIEFCARTLAAFLRSIHSNFDENCRILDYAQLKPSIMSNVADFLRIQTSAEAVPDFDKCFSIYSKDIFATKKFRSDSEKKQENASAELRDAIEKWTSELYDLVSCLPSIRE